MLLYMRQMSLNICLGCLIVNRLVSTHSSVICHPFPYGDPKPLQRLRIHQKRLIPCHNAAAESFHLRIISAYIESVRSFAPNLSIATVPSTDIR